MTNVSRRSRWFVLLVSALVSVGLLAATPGTAQAKCGNKCLKNKVARLTAQVSTLSTQVSTLSNQVSTLNTGMSTLNTGRSCLRRRGVTSYDGYEFNKVAYNSAGAGNGFLTTGLDFTTSGGGSVDAYLLRDICSTIPIG